MLIRVLAKVVSTKVTKDTCYTVSFETYISPDKTERVGGTLKIKLCLACTYFSFYYLKAEYAKGRREMSKEPTVLGRPDFNHAKEVSKYLSQVRFS